MPLLKTSTSNSRIESVGTLHDCYAKKDALMIVRFVAVSKTWEKLCW